MAPAAAAQFAALFAALLSAPLPLPGAVPFPATMTDGAYVRAVDAAWERSDETALVALAETLARDARGRPAASRAAAWGCLAFARDRMDARRFAEAGRFIGAAERLLPGDAQVALFRLRLEAEDGSRDRADALVAGLLARPDVDADALHALARLLLYRVDRRYSARVRAALERSIEADGAGGEAAGRAVSLSLERGDPREARRLLALAGGRGVDPERIATLGRRVDMDERPAPLSPRRALFALLALALAWRLLGPRPALLLAALFALAQFHRLDLPARAALAALAVAALARYRVELVEMIANYYAAHGRTGAAVSLLAGAARFSPPAGASRLRLGAVAQLVSAGRLEAAAAALAAEPPGDPVRDAVAALLHSRRRDVPRAHAAALAALGGAARVVAWQVRIDGLVRAGLASRALALLSLFRDAAPVFGALDLKARLVAGDAVGARATLGRLRASAPAFPCETLSYALLYAALLEPPERRRDLLREAALYHAGNAHAAALAAFAALDAGDPGEAGRLAGRAGAPDPAAGGAPLLFAARFAVARALGHPAPPPPPGEIPPGDAAAPARFRVALALGRAPADALADWLDARGRLAARLAALAGRLERLESGAPDAGDESPDDDLLFAPELLLSDLLVAGGLAAAEGPSGGAGEAPLPREAACSMR